MALEPSPLPTREASNRHDLLALAVLLLSAVVMAAPILFGGWRTYLDNPVHLAELQDMARPGFSGWSDLALCGLPLGHLHSPLWYGLLTALHRLGLPLGPLYVTALLAGFMAPPIALYFLARRRLAAVPACAIAYLLLIQYPTSVGTASALGGMWTFHLASAILLWLLDALSSPTRQLSLALRIAALAGLAGLSHSFAFPALGLLALIHGTAALWRPNRWSILAWDVPALLLGLFAASASWLPLFLVRDWLLPVSSNLPADLVLKLLLLPVDVLDLRQGVLPEVGDLVHGLPMLLLAIMGIWGGVIVVRDRQRSPREMAYGASLGLLVLVLLTVVVARTRIGLLGPLSWRLLYLVRLGFALAGVAVLARHGQALARSSFRVLPLSMGVLAVALGVLWSQPLARDVPWAGERGVQETQRLWAWLAQNRDARWGRVLVQDTFHSTAMALGLENSHLLARTAGETGVEQVGPYYSALPFPTGRWTLTEFSNLLGVPPVGADAWPAFKKRMPAANVTHVVFFGPWAKARAQADPDFQRLQEIGPFTIYRFRDGLSRPAFSGSPIEAEVEKPRPGLMRVHADSTTGGELWLSEAYHPFWKVRGAVGVKLETTEIGLMKLVLPAGKHDLVLEYASPMLPSIVSLVSWGLLALVAIGLRWPKPSQRLVRSTPS